MAAGAGLLLLAITMTAMHFLIIVGFMPLAKRLTARLAGSITMHVTYDEGRGVMSRLLQACDRHQWQLTDLTADAAGEHVTAGSTGVMLTLSGRGILTASTVLAGIEGVTAIRDRVDADQRIELKIEDSVRLAANAVCVDGDVVLSGCSDDLRRRLEERGYRVTATPLDSFLRSGGSAFCLTLRLDRRSDALLRAATAA